MFSPQRCIVGSVFALSCAVLPLRAQITWDGGGTDNDWSTSDNWELPGSPEGQNVIFGDLDETTSALVNSVVNNPTEDSTYQWTLESLTFNNTGATTADWQNLQIDEGVTLTLNAAGTAPTNILTVGGYTAADAKTQVRISGNGALVIDEAASDIWVSNRYSASDVSSNSAYLDMSGLKTFTATVNNFRVGAATSGQNDATGYVALADTNTITAAKLAVGSAPGGQNDTSTFLLGRVNTLNVDGIFIGAPYATFINTENGVMSFNTALTPGEQNSVTIRAADGVSRTNLTIGEHSQGTGTTNRGVTATVDFSGGSVNALINNLYIGQSRSANGGSALGRVTATLRMDEGVMDVVTTRLGRSIIGDGDGINTSTLQVVGGAFSSDTFIMAWNTSGDQATVANFLVGGNAVVTLDSGIMLGDRDGSSLTVQPTLTITGGRVTAGGNIAEGSNGASITSVINLDGGVLDLGGHAIGADTFNARAGVLKNVNEIRDGGASPAVTALVKSGGGSVLTLSGTNAFTGGMTINGGTVAVESGAMTGSGTITVNAGGALALNYGGLQSLLASGRVAAGSTGSIALTEATAGEDIDFNAANLATAFLGAYGDVTYEGTYTPHTDGVYRLGGGLGTLTYAGNITGEDSVVIGGGVGTVVLAGANDFTGGITLEAATLRVTALDDLGDAGNDLTFNGGTLQWAAGSTVDISAGRDVMLSAGGAVLDTNGNAVTLATGIGNSGAGGLAKSGLGTLTLSGASNYTGTTAVNQGTLSLDLSTHTTGVVAAASNVALNGGTLAVKGAASGSSGQTLGALALGAASSSVIAFDPGTGSGTSLTLGAWSRSAGGTVNVDYSQGGTLASSPTLDDGILAYATVTQGGTTRFATVSGGNVGQYTSATSLPSGSTSATTNYVVTGNHTRSSGASLNSLQINNTTAAQFNLNGQNVTISSGGLLMTGTADYLIYNSSTSNGIGVGATTEFIIHQYGSGTLTISANLLDNNVGGLTKTGSGTLIMSSAANTYVEPTIVTGGVLGVTALTYGGTASSIGASTNAASNLVLNGGTLRYLGSTTTTTDRNFTVGGNGGAIESSGDGDLTIWGSLTASATSGSQTFTLGGTNALENRMAGNISDGAGSVTSFVKSGTGRWVLTGDNGYSGSTTVTAGTLIIDGSLARTSGVSVQSAGAIGGTGTINSSLSLASGAGLTMGISGTTAVTGYDQLAVGGTISLAGADLVLALNYAPVEGDMFILLNNDGTDAIAGTFATINGGAFGPGNTFSLSYESETYTFALSYTGGTGNDLVVEAVPEPSTMLFLIGSSAMLGAVLRRRMAGVQA